MRQRRPSASAATSRRIANFSYLCHLFLLGVGVVSVLGACPTFPVPGNGTVVTSGLNTGDFAFVACSPGFVLSGTANRTCLASGAWNGGAIGANNCTLVNCPVLTPPPGVTMSCTPPLNQFGVNQVGSACTFSCSTPGQQLSGNVRQNCTAVSVGFVWQPVWTGAANAPNTCTDLSNFWGARSVCELPVAIGAESCNVCNTLLFEPFDVDPVTSSRWYVVNQPSTGGPSAWSQTTFNGLTIATQTKTGMSCIAGGGGTLCGSALVFAGGQEFYNYKARLNFAYSTVSGSIGLAVHWQDQDNHYEYVMNSNGQRMIRKKVAGVYTNLWSSNFPLGFTANNFVNIEMEVRFGRISVWNDGVLVGHPVYDSTFSKGTVAITTGSSATTPRFDYIMVQQLSAWNPLPAKMRLFVSGRDYHSMYVDGVLQKTAQGDSYQGEYASAEYWVPFTSSTRLAIVGQAYSSRRIGDLPWIMARAPWVGFDTAAGNSAGGWWCAPGFDLTWVQPGFNVTDPFLAPLFKPAVVTGGRGIYGLYISGRDTNPPGIWSDISSGTVDLQVTCVFSGSRLITLSSEPTVVSTSLPQINFMPAGPLINGFDYNSWMKVEPVGTNGATWNYQGFPYGQPSASSWPRMVWPSGWTSMDSTTATGTMLQASDLSVQGGYNLYRCAQGFTNYTFSTRMGILDRTYIGIVWSWIDINNYYEYIIAYADGYHAIRKRVSGIASTIIISHWPNAQGVWVNVSLSVQGGGFELVVNNVKLYTGLLDTSLLAGTFGFHVANSGSGYFFATSINFFKSTPGGTGIASQAAGNEGVWNFLPRQSTASQDMVSESSGAGLTFYAFQNADAAWIQPSCAQLPSTDQRSDWTAQVSVSQSVVTASPGSLGLGFYFFNRNSYYEYVLHSHTLSTISINRRGVGGILLGIVCSASVSSSLANPTLWRLLSVHSRGGILYGYIDGVFACSGVDMAMSQTNPAITLRTQGTIVMISNQTSIGPVSLFRDVRFSWIPLSNQDTGACGTATCACAHGGTCTKGLGWSASSCICTPAWTGPTCSDPFFLANSTIVTGSGLTGGAIGSMLYINISVPISAPVDVFTAGHMNITVVSTNVFGYLIASMQLPVQWGGIGTKFFVANYTVLSTGNVTVYASYDNATNPLGGGPGIWTYQTPAGIYSSNNWKVSGVGVTAPAVGSANVVQMIAQDVNNNEVQGSGATAATITATLTLLTGSQSLLFVYTGIGGRYTSSYSATLAAVGDASLTIHVGGIPLPALTGNPFSFKVSLGGGVRILRTSSSTEPVYFGWKASSAAISAGLTVRAYYLLLSEDSTFSQLQSARYPTAQPQLLPLMITPNTDIYAKVQVQTFDPFTGLVQTTDMPDADCLP